MTVVTIQITGAANPWRLKQVEQEVGRNRLYRKGTDRDLYADMERSDAQLAVVNLNLIHGITADIIQDRSSSAR